VTIARKFSKKLGVRSDADIDPKALSVAWYPTDARVSTCEDAEFGKSG